MRIQPRQQILDIWGAMVSTCYRDEKWRWDGIIGADSISDSEQLLCLLYPAAQIETFALDQPESMSEDVRKVLAPFGGPVGIGTTVLGLIEEYLARNTDAGDVPRFAAGSYLRSPEDGDPTAAQRALEVVDGYSRSVAVCIAALGFARGFDRWAQAERRTAINTRIADLSRDVSTRLTAAMVGLVRSFAVDTLAPHSPSGRAMLGMLNQSGQPQSSVMHDICRSLERVRARLRRDVMLGPALVSELDNEDLLFECGWSWGIVQESSPVDFVPTTIGSGQGFADRRPYLHFTITALDAISDVVSPRTRELGLLDETQQRLAEALRLRWEITQRYWSTVARFGTGTWPLEDIPWRTSDGEESDYFSLLVSAVLIQDLVERSAADDDLTRAVGIFDELARRGRITRRPTRADPSVALHYPGVRMTLRGSELVDGGGSRLEWIASDFAPVLLERLLRAARLSGNITARDQLMELAKQVMDHLDHRMISDGAAAGLWDDPGAAFGASAQRGPLPSWYMTERIVKCLVAADRTYRAVSLRSPAMVVRAAELLHEAEHLLNQAMLDVSVYDTSANRFALDAVEQKLDRARSVIDSQPGTAFTLVSAALIELDQLAWARLDAMRSA
ncbi:SCO2524 family protein [Nocardia sp. NPDC058114]|uniref:SCO2524 family protein n=1 Tax=Nocardia sp. NPDC058114 TaxID=3346346 RepID=UPI0036D8F59D